MRNLFVFTAASMLLLASCQKEKEEKIIIKQDPPVHKPLPVAGKECFLKVIAKDSIVFEMERAGDSVHGILHWKPYEKDKKISTYRGVLNGTRGTAIASSKAEGMDYKEELLFNLQGGSVTIEYGEMAEDKDGIWKYKDTTSTSLQALPKIDCK
jgi:hypothetical protein